MASVHSRPMARNRVVWQLKYRIRVGTADGAGRLASRSLTFDDQAQAEHWCGIFNAAGAERALQLLDAELDAVGPAAAGPATAVATVRDVVEAYVSTKSGITNGTRVDYRAEARRDIYPYLGDLPVTALAPPHGEDVVAAWVNQLHSTDRIGGRPLSGKTIENRHSLLSSSLTRAVGRGLLAGNVCPRVALPPPNAEPMVFLEQDEWWLLYDCIPPAYQLLCYTLVGTGARFSEATALRRRHFDMVHSEVRIHQAWKHDRSRRAADRELGPPKSGAGVRVVALGADLGAALEPRLALLQPDDLVFTNAHGRAITNAAFHARPWPAALRAAKQAGLRKVPRPHDLRHTFASRMLAHEQMNIFELAVVMGHDDVKMLRKRYGHLVRETREAMHAAADSATARPPARLHAV